MSAIATIEATASKLLSAAFGIDFIAGSALLSNDASPIAVTGGVGDREPASEAENFSSAGDSAEWMPLCNGSGSALALSLLDVLWNELGVYDEEFLKRETNAPFLVGGDGSYLRDALTRRPLTFDAFDRRIKSIDDPSLRDPSIRWSCETNGRQVRPAFELLRERLAYYAPEIVEPLTRIPAATVRRIAVEFAAQSLADFSPLQPGPIPNDGSAA